MDPEYFQTGGAVRGAVGRSLLQSGGDVPGLGPGSPVGVYRVVREIGRGGMAVVYLAERDDGEYRQQVALKWLPAGLADPTTEALFRRERQALADLRHPHIARLLDGGRGDDGRPWLAMEYIEGEPLDRHCTLQHLPLPERLQLFLQVCTAVAFAHARGVIHRDIKPSNVLVDSDGGVRLLDFGIAQLLGHDDELAARAFTPGYASPEQVRGEAPTVASDVYQLGRLLATLLGCGADPALSQSLVTTPAAPAPALPSSLPADLRWILRCALADAPEQRYPTVDALASDLRAWLAGRPVQARPAGAGYLLARFLGRHPAGSVATATALLLLVAGSLYFTQRLREQRDMATYQARVATAVLGFLQQDLLAAADPGAAPGRELTVREALDRASAAADVRFAGTPSEHSTIRATLADLFGQLGRLADSEREARRALQLAGLDGVQAATRAHAQLSLVDVLIARDRLGEAEHHLNQFTTQPQPSTAAGRRLQLAAELRRGILLHRRGEYLEALQVVVDAEEAAAIALGDDDPLTLALTEEAANGLQMLGRHAEAFPLRESLLRRRRAALGPQHPATLEAAHGLGVLLRHRGDAESSLALLSEAVEARRAVLGDGHPGTLASMNEMASVLQDLKRYEAAEPLFREVLETRLQVLGEEHLFSRNSMSNLGLLYSLSGQLDQAAPLYERALAIDLRLGGGKHPDTLALMHNIAGLYRRQSRHEDALAMHGRAVTGAESSPDLGPGSWQAGLFRIGRGLSLEAAGQPEAADAEIESAIGVLEHSLGAQHPRTQRAREIRQELHASRAGNRD